MDDHRRLEILQSQLEQEGFYDLKVIPGQGICGMMRFIFTTAIVVGIDNVGYRGRYCYPHALVKECVLAYNIWDGTGHPLGGWLKYKGGDGEFCNPKLENEYN